MAFNPFKLIKVKSGGAYDVLKDDRRLTEYCIQEQVDFITQEKIETGMYLNKDCEMLPVFGPVAPIERVIARKQEGSKPSGARIVLTKDNYGSRATGYGGQGGTMCEAIDIVAGSLSCENVIKTVSTESRANFISDGARIYLTERGDIQHYFCLGDGSKATSISSELKSGIGIKADHTLVIGRERVRILVGLSKAHGKERLVNNNRQITPKIEIARIGDDSAQPAVMGRNLVKYLREQNKEVQALRNRIQDIETNLVKYKTAMALHTHSGAGLGYVQIFPSPEAATQGGKSIASFLETTIGNIIETYKARMKDFRAMGTENEVLAGTPEARLLSSTVYIGM